jgi:divalent metal cation (Fe/Co/Zn/Cd) transporter
MANLVSSVNVGLGMLAALIIAYEFFWQIVALAVLVVGLYILWDNLRELRR